MGWINGAQGFLLLTIDGVEVLLDRSNASTAPIINAGDTIGRVHGQLSVECVTLPNQAVGAADGHIYGGRDVFPVLRVDSHGVWFLSFSYCPACLTLLCYCRVCYYPDSGHHIRH